MQLSDEQITSILSEIAKDENGYQKLLTIALEAMMRSERKEYNKLNSDVSNGYRSSRVYGQGKIMELRVPRSRHGQFYPVILSLLRNQEEESRQLAYELYGAGLTTSQVGSLFEKVYGQHYSKSSVSRMFSDARQDVQQWLERPLEDYYPIIYIDATFIPTRRGNTVSKEAYYTILGVRSDRSREVLGIFNFPTESASGWLSVLHEIKARGVKEVDLIVSDGLSAIEDAAASVWLGVTHQLCTIHLRRSILSKVRPKDKSEVAEDLSAVFRVDLPEDTPAKGYARWQAFCAKWRKTYPSLKAKGETTRYMLYFNYLEYDHRIRPMVHSTNWVERLNRDYKRTTRMRGALPDSASTMLLLGYVAMNKKAYMKMVPNLKYATQFKWGKHENV